MRQPMLALATTMWLTPPAFSQLPQTEMIRLETPPPPNTQPWFNFFFGSAVGVDQDTLVISDPSAGPLGSEGGEVYFYCDTDRGWRLCQRLPAATPFGRFGSALALNGDHVAISAPFFGFPGNQEGRVFVYERNLLGRWVIAQEIAPPGPSRDSRFGDSLAMDDQRLVVGSPSDSIGAGSGAFFVYERSGGTPPWQLQQQVVNDSPLNVPFLGNSVAIEGDCLLVSARGDIQRPGEVRVYEEQSGQWILTQVLGSSPPEEGDEFGGSISLRGDELLIGAPAGGTGRPGLAVLFERSSSGWVPRQAFRASDESPTNLFGGSTALGDGVAFVGAGGAINGGQTPGKVYQFVRTNGIWPNLETRQLVARGFDSGLLGESMPYDGTTLVVGDRQDRAVFTYREELGNNQCRWMSPDRARLRSTGSLQASDEDLTLAARDLEPGALVIFAASRATAQIPFGDGMLCVGAPIVRLNRTPDVVGSLGVVFRSLEFDDPRLAGLTAGATWTFQAWHTHSQAPIRRLTNAVRLTLN